MGRDITGIRTDKTPNSVKLKIESIESQETAHVSPKISGLRLEEKDSKFEENQHKLDVLGTTKNEIKSESNNVNKMDSPVTGDGKPDDAFSNEPVASTETPAAEGESTDSTGEKTDKINNIDVPTKEKKSQPNSPRGPTKPPHADRKKQFDEEDNFFAASPAAASAKTAKFKTTVPIAPVFKCVARAKKRKEFYSKLEEKQAAMKAEKMENEARIKEKEQAFIRKLRKNMVFKANPMPSFYQEGHPPKTELKKFPVTRAKSPKLNGRKSCSDVMRRASFKDKAKENQQAVRLT